MKRVNVFQIVLELIVILGFLVVGTTIITYLIQKIAVDRIVIGLLIMAIGLFGITEFFTMKYVTRIKSIANVIVNVLAVAFGIVIIIIKVEFNQLCILLGWFYIGFSVGRTITAAINLLRQPLLNGIIIILYIITIVFAVFLLVKTTAYLNTFLLLLGISSLIEGATLFIEFLIHRYSN